MGFFRRNHVSGVLLIVATVALLAMVVASSDGFDLRRFSNALGVTVFALLIWRTVGSWARLTDLERVLALLLAISPLVSALASVSLQRRAGGVLPDNPWLWGVLAHRVLCLGVVVHWDRLLGRRQGMANRRG